MKKLAIILLLLSLLSCAGSKRSKYYSAPIKTIFSELKLPDWISNFPKSNDYTIGISYKTLNTEEMKADAQRFAAVEIVKNQSSYVVNKYAGNDNESACLKINVVSDPSKMKRIYPDLACVDSAIVNNYFIGLFKIKDSPQVDFSKKIISNNTMQRAEWYIRDEITPDGEKYCSCTMASSSDLINAFKKATENSRLNIANFLEKDINSVLYNTDAKTEKFISMESNIILKNIRIEKMFFAYRIQDSLPIYKVYLKMSFKTE